MYLIIRPLDPSQVMRQFVEQQKRQTCAHMFSMGLYVPPGQTMYVNCPHCGASIPVHGNGPTC